MKANAFLLAVAGLSLSACGGGGGGGTSPPTSPPVSPPPPPMAVLSGQFKDANTAGLSYSTATQSGVTDNSGRFSYRSGETVQFAVGGIVIGETGGAPIVTPVDLVPDGSSDSRQVRNIVRFLMMMDQNADPADGIFISQAVRDMAANWSQVDFSTDDLDNELVTIVSDVASVDQRTPVLADAAAAQAHLEDTFRCLVSGLFVGNFAGDRTSTIFLLVYPSTGRVKANYRFSLGQQFNGVEPVSVDQQRTFLSEIPGVEDSRLEGRFDSFDEISGSWTAGISSGTFSASRAMPDALARYRLTGEWFHGVVKQTLDGVEVFNIDSNGNLVGVGYSVETGNRFPNSGMLTGQDIVINWDVGAVSQGTLEADLSVSGTGTNSAGASRPWFAQGCRLN